MSQNLSDDELSEKLKPLNKKTKIFFTLGDIFIKLMLFLAAVSILLLFVVVKFGVILFVCSAFSCTFIAIICKKIGLRYGNEMVQLTLNMAEGMLKNNFDLKTFYPDGCISRDEVHKAKMFNWNEFVGYNCFHANYRGADFVCSDLELKLHMNKQTHDVFCGQWLVITMDKEITPSVTVTELSYKNLINDKREKVEMESAAFNKQFMVFTDDPQKAFYVLTPHFMEFIMSLKQSTESKIHLCFDGLLAHIAVSTGRASFAPYQEEHDIKQLRSRMQKEVDFIKRVIDGFYQNERLFGSESVGHGPGEKKYNGQQNEFVLKQSNELVKKKSKGLAIATVAFLISISAFIVILIIILITTFLPVPVKTICPSLDTKNNRMHIRVDIDQKFKPDRREISDLLDALTPARRGARRRDPVFYHTYFSDAQVKGNYTIRTSYGNITLRNGAKVHLYGSGRKSTAIGQIYTRNFLTDTLQEDLSLFSYDRETRYSTISGREFMVTGFMVGRGADSLLFYIGKGTTLVINDVEIQIPPEGAHLQIKYDEWALYSAEHEQPFDFAGPRRNSLGIRLMEKQTDFTACNVVFIKPGWHEVESYNVRDGGNFHTVRIETLRLRFVWEELTEELYRIIRKK